ncbi:MAG: DUF4157 domain-containing protein [Acidobacteria bacterium]|nr:DUF4157 domain-containing protein [Acidobacteriota bacterium]
MPDNNNNVNGTAHLSTPQDVKSNSQSTPLPPTLQHHYENELQADLSNVRVHQGHAPTLLGVQSYTSGQDVFFAPGKYQPHTEDGRQLLAHELTHVVQQRQGSANDE